MTVAATCRDCHRPRKPDELFCECGAFYDYTVATGEQRTDGEPDAEEEFEWPPQATYKPSKPSEPTGTSAVSMRLVHCRKEECKTLNPETLVFCWKCGTSIAHGVEATPPRSLRRFLRLEKTPPPAGQHTPPDKPFVSKDDPRSLLQAGLIVAGVLLLAGALILGAIKAWGPTSKSVVDGYGVAREAFFPRYHSVHPSSVNPPREEKRGKKRVKIPHPPAAAFDRNLSTYWQTRTARQAPDKISVTFNPAVHHIEEFVVFAGDPTGTTIVPSSLQMTFYRWDPAPTRQSDCERRPPRGVFPLWLRRGTHCVIAVDGPFELKNTPAQQRFSTGKHADVALVVVTIRGVHSTDNPKLKAGITEIEFFDRD